LYPLEFFPDSRGICEVSQALHRLHNSKGFLVGFGAGRQTFFRVFCIFGQIGSQGHFVQGRTHYFSKEVAPSPNWNLGAFLYPLEFLPNSRRIRDVPQALPYIIPRASWLDLAQGARQFSEISAILTKLAPKAISYKVERIILVRKLHLAKTGIWEAARAGPAAPAADLDRPGGTGSHLDQPLGTGSQLPPARRHRQPTCAGR